MTNKEYQYKICKFLVQRRLDDKDEQMRIVIFRLKDFPLFDRKKSIKENMGKFKQALNEIIKYSSKDPVIEIRNKEVLNGLVENYNNNKEIKIKYKRIKLDYFLGKIHSKAHPNKFFLRKFILNKKIKIYYNGKDIGFGCRKKRGRICRFMFGDYVRDPDMDDQFEYYSSHPDEKPDGKYYISFNNLHMQYWPGVTEIKTLDLVCLFYYHGDDDKINLQSNIQSNLKESYKKNKAINLNLKRINEKVKNEFGIDLLEIIPSRQEDYNYRIKLAKLGKIEKFDIV
jgi:hypothetical protein